MSYWFDPVLDRLEALEAASCVFKDVYEGLSDEAPEWVAKCLYNGVTPFRKFLGLDNFADGMTAKRFGTIVGNKVSLCQAMANTHVLFQMFSAKQLKQIEDAWGKEELSFARSIYEFFAKEVKSKADKLRRAAAELAASQSTEQHIDYMLGYVLGVRMMEQARKAAQKALQNRNDKRERDSNIRAQVHWFAVSNWKEIEANRRTLTWMQLTEKFDRETGQKFEVDEETFKKILQRASLTIGKSSKPMSKGRSRTGR